MSDQKHYEKMLFHVETTNKASYCNGEIKASLKTVYKRKPTCYRIRPPPLRDIHTLIDWKNARIPPFNLFHKPKDVVGTNPWKGQQPYKKSEDEEKETVRKSRPRLVMTPAVSMDDVEQPATREVLCGDIYSSTYARAAQELAAKLPRRSTRAPLPKLPAPANPITLQKLQPSFVSPEWRMDSVSWDGKQQRAHCDATATFWLQQEPPNCKMCDETAEITAHRKMLRESKKKK